jgi:hypothetical protein
VKRIDTNSELKEDGMKIVAICSIGMIGSKLVNLLRQGGHEVVEASLASGVNTITGEGLAEAFSERLGLVMLGGDTPTQPEATPEREEAEMIWREIEEHL